MIVFFACLAALGLAGILVVTIGDVLTRLRRVKAPPVEANWWDGKGPSR